MCFCYRYNCMQKIEWVNWRKIQCERAAGLVHTFVSAFDLVHATLEKFKNGCLTLKTHQFFFVHTAPKKFKNVTITGTFDLCGKAPFMMFLFTRKRKKRHLPICKFLRCEQRFRKAPLSLMDQCGPWV